MTPDHRIFAQGLFAVGIALAVCLAGGVAAVAQESYQLVLLDLSSGDAALILSSSGTSILVGCARETSEVRQHLSELGISSINLIIALDTSESYVLGLAKLIDEFGVEAIITGPLPPESGIPTLAESASAPEGAQHLAIASGGDSFQLGGRENDTMCLTVASLCLTEESERATQSLILAVTLHETVILFLRDIPPDLQSAVPVAVSGAAPDIVVIHRCNSLGPAFPSTGDGLLAITYDDGRWEQPCLSETVGWSQAVADHRDVETEGVVRVAIPCPKSKCAAPVALVQARSAGMVATFDASGSFDPDGEVVRIAWDFGDEQTAEGERVTHRYDWPGEYVVIVVVTDDGGLVTTEVVRVSVR